jgi:uncharacterized protein YndB with AHSA1/START domain
MAIQNKTDWSQFEVSIPLNFPPAQIISAWTSQEGLEKWFLRLAEFADGNGKVRGRNDTIQPGDSYKWMWHGWPDTVVETGNIIPCKDQEFVRFTFGKAGVVGVSIISQEGESILRLTQEHIPIDEESVMNYHVGCKTGWTFYLLHLKSILYGGQDLRNKNNSLQLD